MVLLVMRLIVWLCECWLFVVIVVIGLLVGVIQLVCWWMMLELGQYDFVGLLCLGYMFINFWLFSYDCEGLLVFNVIVLYLEWCEGDELFYINLLVFDLFFNQVGVLDWCGELLYGWVNQGGDLFKLFGLVYMYCEVFDDIVVVQFDIVDMIIWLKENWMEIVVVVWMV